MDGRRSFDEFRGILHHIFGFYRSESILQYHLVGMPFPEIFLGFHFLENISRFGPNMFFHQPRHFG